MKTVLLLFGALSLIGCQSKSLDEMSYSEIKALSNDVHKRCLDQGVKTRTAEMSVCLDHELNREVAVRKSNRAKRQAFGGAMSDVGGQMQANAQNQQIVNRPVDCTSTGSGTHVGQITRINTTCY